MILLAQPSKSQSAISPDPSAAEHSQVTQTLPIRCVLKTSVGSKWLGKQLDGVYGWTVPSWGIRSQVPFGAVWSCCQQQWENRELSQGQLSRGNTQPNSVVFLISFLDSSLFELTWEDYVVYNSEFWHIMLEKGIPILLKEKKKVPKFPQMFFIFK